MGLWSLTCGLEHTNMWAEQNRASVWVRQRLCYNEIQATFCYNKASVESKYGRSWSNTHSLSGVFSGKSTDEKGLF